MLLSLFYCDGIFGCYKSPPIDLASTPRKIGPSPNTCYHDPSVMLLPTLIERINGSGLDGGGGDRPAKQFSEGLSGLVRMPNFSNIRENAHSTEYRVLNLRENAHSTECCKF
jgi:hypothetical protein